jgi:hypothetical protein
MYPYVAPDTVKELNQRTPLNAALTRVECAGLDTSTLNH